MTTDDYREGWDSTSSDDDLDLEVSDENECVWEGDDDERECITHSSFESDIPGICIWLTQSHDLGLLPDDDDPRTA